jgi:hypothetical protein
MHAQAAGDCVFSCNYQPASPFQFIHQPQQLRHSWVPANVCSRAFAQCRKQGSSISLRNRTSGSGITGWAA